MKQDYREKMAETMKSEFKDSFVIVLPIDHGGGREAAELRKYLDENFIFYEKKGRLWTASHCLDQSNDYIYNGEARPIITPPEDVAEFIDKKVGIGKAKWLLFLDSETKSSDAPSIVGAKIYGIKNAKYFGLTDYRKALTGVIIDRIGAADVSTIPKNKRKYRDTLEFMRENSITAYYSLLKPNGPIEPDNEKDGIYLDAALHNRRKVMISLTGIIFSSSEKDPIKDTLTMLRRRYLLE